MNTQERELLTSFLREMSQAQAGQKDAEADALIREAGARQPDAVYLLVQRAMQLEYALSATQAQAAKLQAELDQQRGAARTGFLDNPNAWGRQAPAPAAASASSMATSQPRAPEAPAAGLRPASSWGSGMLGNVATTAAGVVAGSFLFQGIQGLMGHHNPAADALSPQAAANTATNEDHATPPHDDPMDVAAADNADYGDFGDSGDSA